MIRPVSVRAFVVNRVTPLTEVIGLTVGWEPTCAHCGAPLAPPSQWYCGVKCRERAKQRRYLENREKRGVPTQRTHPVSAELRMQVYERDDWTCQLCLQPVDRAAPKHSDWSATVDHIIELANGGLSEPSNLQTAHRVCNINRSNGTMTAHAWDSSLDDVAERMEQERKRAQGDSQ